MILSYNFPAVCVIPLRLIQLIVPPCHPDAFISQGHPSVRAAATGKKEEEEGGKKAGAGEGELGCKSDEKIAPIGSGSGELSTANRNKRSSVLGNAVRSGSLPRRGRNKRPDFHQNDQRRNEPRGNFTTLDH
ncbi:hypothetical protein KM043_006877 [Ampulex compressa]|nr:hypothetical protein KM043_006877 [Ampulex compressa]